ncbi:class I SAM-dependent methyltransferase [uncultured Methylibium sp.]|uniref:class I SAM-dependent methyltransferase n=1 Tax=uncultured Methylibium sp. TaxID=381093 RepID=UPI0025F573F7|nr:class I SAM-dependent methyltransferase [uncultured Methylibium sp.]
MTVHSPDAWERAVLWLRAQSDRQSLVRDAYYDDPLIDAATRYWRSSEWQALRAWLPAAVGARALDVGAGRGIASFALARDGFQVTALEPNASDVVGAGAISALAAEAGLPITVVQEASERLPFDDASFDLVFARAVLHHTRDLDAACREFLRVLRPGGRLVAVREHVISHDTDLPAFFDVHPLHHLYGGENAFRLERYTQAIASAGFSLRRVVAPLDSAVNLAPHTAETFKAELAARATRRVPGLRGPLCLALDLPGSWALLRRMLRRFDHRPGRLYSFVAERP